MEKIQRETNSFELSELPINSLKIDFNEKKIWIDGIEQKGVRGISMSYDAGKDGCFMITIDKFDIYYKTSI